MGGMMRAYHTRYDNEDEDPLIQNEDEHPIADIQNDSPTEATMLTFEDESVTTPKPTLKIKYKNSFASEYNVDAEARSSPEKDEYFKETTFECGEEQHTASDGFSGTEADTADYGSSIEAKQLVGYVASQKTDGHLCESCGKSFFSVKSLHGHMRVHRNRNTRMSTRKINKDSPIPHAFNKKGMRGRKGTKPFYDHPYFGTKEGIVANILLQIKYGASQAVEDDDSKHILLRDLKHAREILKKKAKKKIKYMEQRLNSRRTLSQKEFKCNICNMCFLSHQALGGHKAGHKNKNNISSTDPSPNVVGQFVDSLIESPKMSAAEHRCKMCNEAFPTGQALGGHMRRHWRAPQNRSPTTSSETAEANQRNFDLNELPECDDDDIEYG